MGYTSKTSKGFKSLTFGDTATGKTASVPTLLLAGQKVRFVSADNNAEAGLNAGIHLHKVPEDLQSNLAICIPERPAPATKDILADIERLLATEYDVYLKGKDPSRKGQRGFYNIVSSSVEFTDVEGKSHGLVSDWGTDTTLVLDSLSVICREIKTTVAGVMQPSQPQWGAMQNLLEGFLARIGAITCNVVVLGHPEKDTDAVTGATRIYPRSLGKALNNVLPSGFSDVLYSQFDGKKYFWSTKHRTAVCSGRNLPIKEELDQDYRQFFDKQ